MRLRMILGFVVLVAASLSAQTFRATILGTVTDSTGAVISGAKVTVKIQPPGLNAPPRPAPTGATAFLSCPWAPIQSPFHRADFRPR